MPKLAEAKKNGGGKAAASKPAAEPGANGAAPKPAAAKVPPAAGSPKQAAKAAKPAAVDKELQEFLHAGPRPVIYPNVEVMRCWNSPPPAEDRDVMIANVVRDVEGAMGGAPSNSLTNFLSFLGGSDPAAPTLWAAVKACVDGADGCGALTVEQGKALLGWEAEPDFKARAAAAAKEAEDAGDAARAAKFVNLAKLGFGDEFLLKDEGGNKVRCWNNVNNRDVDGNRMRAHAQVVIRREWAGPSFFPGETVNGETIIVTRTAATARAQHRLGGLVLAGQIWDKAKPGDKAFGVDVRKMWPEEPFLESLVVLGISDDPRIIKTIDNVKPRSLADVMTTSRKFDDLDRATKADATRCLAGAIDLLWKRTGAGGSAESKVLQTHQSSEEFLGRHPRLMECVRHAVECNRERHLSKVGLQPAWVAAACYLMATSGTDPKRYRDATNQLAFSEKALDFGRLDKAKAFVVGIAKMTTGMTAVRNAVAKLVDVGMARGTEKLIVLAKAWLNVLAGRAQDIDELMPRTEQDANGIAVLAEWPGFGGIDNGPDHREVDGRGEDDDAAVKAEAARVRAENLKKMEEQGKRKEGEPVVRAPGEVQPAPATARVDGKPAPVKATGGPAPATAAKKPAAAAAKPAVAAKK